jgi:thioredoxin
MTTKKQFNSFEEMLSGSDVPVLVDFYAEWCGPCQMMTPILEMVNTHFQGQLRVVKIDTEKYSQLATQYHIEHYQLSSCLKMVSQFIKLRV